MMAFIFEELKTGFTVTLNSFDFLIKHTRLLAYTIIIPLLTIFFLPTVDFIILRSGIPFLASYLIIRFITNAILTFLFFIAVTYIFQSAGYLPLHVSLMARMRGKEIIMLMWSAIGSLSKLIMHNDVGFNIQFELTLGSYFYRMSGSAKAHAEDIWWAITLLFIIIMADNPSGFIDAIKKIYFFVKEKWALLLAAVISFFCIKNTIDLIFHYIILYTPNLLLKLHLVSYEQLFPPAPHNADVVLTFFAAQTFSGAALSAIMIAIQIICISGCYLEYEGNDALSTPINWKQFAVYCILGLICYAATLIILNSLLALVSIHIPFIGQSLIAFFR